MSNEIVLQIKNIHKRFPGVHALNNVSIEARKGEVLGLVGVNGAGKSTLMNILGGVLKPDAGSILIDGKPAAINSPRDSEHYGIAFIQQEIQLFFNLTVYENIFLRRLQKYKKSRYLPVLDKKALRRDATKYLDMLGCDISPDRKLRSLSVGEQQMVQIARALAQGGKILLFDEPTSSLSFKEKEHLFEVIRKLKEAEQTIIFISHHLDEVKEICDRVVVMCDGKVAGQGLIDDLSKEEITNLMIPKKVAFVDDSEGSISSEVVLKVENLTGTKYPKNISFELHKGEVLGLWGVLGSGRTETVKAILGFDPIVSGKIYFRGKDGLKEISPGKLMKECGYVTEGRHFDGLFLPMPVWQNITSCNLKQFTGRFFSILKANAEKAESMRIIKQLNVVPPNHMVSVQNLSGGNQQKVVIGKWLSRKPKILFLDEPTRGVDVGAKVEIQNLIRSLAKDGVSCILISSEVEEVQRLCDNVIVLRDGQITAKIPKHKMTHETLIKQCLGEG